MRVPSTILGLSILLPLTLSAASQVPEPLVTLHFSPDLNCNGTDPKVLKIYDTSCHVMPSIGLRPVAWSGKLRYNSLRVFRTFDCRDGWTLEPLKDHCSDVRDYRAVRVELPR
ncbi:hypothetical protein B0J11DRAFT_502080 [Dendryphion nanum]|uniref:Uncharacterized protein n=1 Tax=Dendryphion nanum TaxID=256645 RepID=A0A9P9EBC3_9PLEO|nr:hypothetical protein B0J11DRAFT_502080 [Dendryphion nanum]